MRFSSRLAWDSPVNRLWQAFEAGRRAGLRILDLTQSNPTRAGFSYPEAIREVLADPGVLVYEPAPAGAPVARAAVAAYYASRGEDVDPGQIVLTSSTSEAYSWLFKLLCDPGDEVLVPRPSYPLFDFLAGLEAVRPIQYPLLYDGGWSVDCDALVAAVTPRTRAVILVHPNNPTGSVIRPAELTRLSEICATHGLVLISDEVFSDYPLAADVDFVPTLAGFEQAPLFTLNGLSKSVGLPQMKLAWIVAGGPPRWRSDALERLELIADTYLPASAPVQCALSRLMGLGSQVRRQIQQRVRANWTRVASVIGRGGPCELLRAEAGWYAVLRVPRTRSEEQWCLELLERHGVWVQPGYFFDFLSEAYLVLSLLTPPAELEEGLEALRRLVET